MRSISLATSSPACCTNCFLIPSLTPIDEWIRTLSSVKTPLELETIRQACVIAKSAYELGASQIRAGMKEPEAAQLFRAPLSSNDVFRAAGSAMRWLRVLHVRSQFGESLCGLRAHARARLWNRTTW